MADVSPNVSDEEDMTANATIERSVIENEASSQDGRDRPSDAVRLDVWVRDPELVGALEGVPEGRRREEFALGALKIGVLALRQAQGRIDSDVVRMEGDRLIANLAVHLTTHQGQMTAQLAGTLREYFDPDSGRFNERVERLVKQDGELENVLRTRMETSINSLKAALDPYIGEGSKLMELLTPSESNALIGTIKSSVDDLVGAQQARLLTEFSLDNKTGALARLVAALEAMKARKQESLASTAQGRDFEEKAYKFIEDVTKNFGDVPERMGGRKDCRISGLPIVYSRKTVSLLRYRK